MAVKRNKYKDILVIVIGFCIIGLGFKIPEMVYAALALGLICAFFETAAHYVAIGWEKLGLVLGMISSTVLLSLLYILVVSPLSLIRRITEGKKAETQSNWTDTDGDAVDFEKQW